MGAIQLKKEQFEKYILKDEFTKLVNCPEQKEELLKLSKYIRLMDGFDQKNPHHCYDVFMHSAFTVENVKREMIKEERNYRQLRIAAFFHDIGKPICAKEVVDRQGTKKRIYLNHPVISHKITEDILDRLNYAQEDKKRILFYILNHDVFMNVRLLDDFFTKNELVKIDRIIHKVLEPGMNYMDFYPITYLMIADAKAQAPFVYDREGHVVDSSWNKVRKIQRIQSYIQERAKSQIQ